MAANLFALTRQLISPDDPVPAERNAVETAVPHTGFPSFSGVGAQRVAASIDFLYSLFKEATSRSQI
jgi:hypothetical protein